MKKKLILASLLGLVLALAMGVPAMAAHPHHVDTGNDGCVELPDEGYVSFTAGLHKAGKASGLDRGPEHGDCPS